MLEMLVGCLEKAELSNYRLNSKLYFSEPTGLCHFLFIGWRQYTRIFQAQTPSLAEVCLHSAKESAGEKVETGEGHFSFISTLLR